MSELFVENAESTRKRKREPSSAPSDASISRTSTPAPVAGSGIAPEVTQAPLSATQPILESTAAPGTSSTITPAPLKPPTFVPAPNPSKLFLTPDIPTNRATFRYTPAGPAPPGNLVLHRSVDGAPPGVRFSWEDRSPHIRISRDGLVVEGFGGFRSARVNVPIREGSWYLEIVIERSEPSSSTNTKEERENATVGLGKHVRLGWGRREASLNGPVGLDGYSYGLRDATGQAVTLSLLKPYGSPFKQGDVVGMYISIPPRPPPPSSNDDPFDPARLVRKRIPIGLKMGPYFESAEYKVSKEMKTLLEEATNTTTAAPTTTGAGKKRKGEARPAKTTHSADEGPLRPLPTLAESKIAYFVNGVPQGIAFKDIYDYLQLRETPKRGKHQTHLQRHFNPNGSLNLKERNNPFDDGTLGYYPMISLFHDARVRLNAGPDFAFPPPNDIDGVLEGGTGDAPERTWRPLSDRYAEFMAESYSLDEMEEEQARERAALQPIIKGDESGEERRKETKKKGKGGGSHGRAGSASLSAGGAGSVRATSGTPQPGSGLAVGSTPNSATAATTPAPDSAEATPPPVAVGTPMEMGDENVKMEVD
ncbi:hypothetical protein M408DRAFT_328239 [Serendipita vermifera MAFF 305830]|uniref:B30.2/SPRY domain-containing protein n=1 Tax=Serendipita vermifera MAFF 305830 TaxID=933852 RepID=A0A0C3BDG0_SERVB|nr:hypothetical protein M408DRAFT_328239 [Serendipita vermifera MAFF 305830]